jgi:hypothetical protein
MSEIEVKCRLAARSIALIAWRWASELNDAGHCVRVVFSQSHS